MTVGDGLVVAVFVAVGASDGALAGDATTRKPRLL